MSSKFYQYSRPAMMISRVSEHRSRSWRSKAEILLCGMLMGAYILHQSLYVPRSYNLMHPTRKRHRPVIEVGNGKRTSSWEYTEKNKICNFTYPFQFICLTEPSGRGVGNPFALPLLGIVLHHLSCYVAWTNAINSAKLNPLYREASSEVQ